MGALFGRGETLADHQHIEIGVMAGGRILAVPFHLIHDVCDEFETRIAVAAASPRIADEQLIRSLV